MVRKQVKALTVLYLVPCQHFGVYFAPYQILLVMGAVFVLLAIPFLLLFGFSFSIVSHFSAMFIFNHRYFLF